MGHCVPLGLVAFVVVCVCVCGGRLLDVGLSGLGGEGLSLRCLYNYLNDC